MHRHKLQGRALVGLGRSRKSSKVHGECGYLLSGRSESGFASGIPARIKRAQPCLWKMPARQLRHHRSPSSFLLLAFFMNMLAVLKLVFFVVTVARSLVSVRNLVEVAYAETFGLLQI